MSKAIDDQLQQFLEHLEKQGAITHKCFERSFGHLVGLLTVLRNRTRSEPEYWNAVRAQFPFAKPGAVVPMNAANLCPRPTALTKALNSLRECFDDDVSQQRRTGYFAGLIDRTKSRLACGLGCSPGNLAIVRNTSEANNAINCGYRTWAEGDKVVLWAENHPTNNMAWDLRAEWLPEDKKGPPRFKVVRVPSNPGNSEAEIAAAFTDRIGIGKETRFVSFTETSNGSGFRIPRGAIRQIYDHVTSNKLDCHIHIDGAMTWGAQDLTLEGERPNRLYCHSFSSSAHKWLCGPKETGILWMDPRKATQFQPSIFAYDYRIKVPEEEWNEMPKDAQRFEMLGQRDDVNIIALYFAQRVHDAINHGGKYSVAGRVRHLGSFAIEELRKHNWELVEPNVEKFGLAVIRVKAPRTEGSEKPNLYKWLYDNAKIAGSGGGKTLDSETFRLCPHFYNVEADISRAVIRMNEWRGLP